MMRSPPCFLWLVVSFQIVADVDAAARLTGTRVVSVGFLPHEMILSPSGGTALLYAQPSNWHDRDKTTKPELVVVDLDKAKVLARREIEGGIRCVTFGEGAVFLAPRAREGLLVCLHAETLTRQERTFVDEPFSSLDVLGDGKLAVRGRDFLLVLDPVKLQPVEGHPGHKAVLLERGMAIAGPHVIDRKTGTLRFLLGTARLPGLVITRRGYPQSGVEPVRTRWGRVATRTGLQSGSRQPIARWEATGAVLLQEHPLAACVQVHAGGAARKPRIRLELHDLSRGEVVAEGVLTPKRSAKVKSSRRPRPLLNAAGGRVVFSWGESLFITEISAKLASKAPAPLQFELDGVLTTGVDKPFRRHFKVSGGKPPYQVEVINESKDMHRDTATGEVVVDVPGLWKRYVETLEKTEGFHLGQSDPGGLIASSPRTYRDLTGKDDPDGKLAYGIPLKLSVRDSTGEENLLATTLIVLAPFDEVVDSLVRAELIKGDRAMWERVVARIKSKPTAYPAVDRLEDRLDRIEDALPRILEKLARIEKALGIEPKSSLKRRGRR